MRMINLESYSDKPISKKIKDSLVWMHLNPKIEPYEPNRHTINFKSPVIDGKLNNKLFMTFWNPFTDANVIDTGLTRDLGVKRMGVRRLNSHKFF